MAKTSTVYDTYNPTAKTPFSRKVIEKSPVSIKEWVITFVLLCIPIVNIVCVIMWSFSKIIPLSKRNFARAILIISIILMVIGSVLVILTGVLFDSALATLISETATTAA